MFISRVIQNELGPFEHR